MTESLVIQNGNMKSSALYYPYIRVPQSPWFTRVLLYWDEVGAIVPYEYIEDPERLGQYMVGLVREGLVTQVVPGMHLWKVPEFQEAFLNYLDKRSAAQLSREEDWPPVHMEKLQSLGEQLCSRGLARKDAGSPHSPWYQLEPGVADDFMAYLAAVLGKVGGDRVFSPLTDQEGHIDRFLSSAPSLPRQEPIRKLVLRELLPGPSVAIEPSQLAEFKGRHHEALGQFRTEVENKVLEWSLIENEADRRVAVDAGVRQMREGVREIRALMEKAKWPRLGFSNLCIVVGSGLSAWKGLIDGDIQFGVVGAALSLAPVVYDAFRGSQVVFDERPLAYAVLTEAFASSRSTVG
jgi:hypothetical protein